jgi:hypothetical protein
VSRVLACDRCHAAEGTVQTVELWEKEDEYYMVDLCSDCLFAFFKWRGMRRDYELQPIMAKKMRDYVKGRMGL